MPIATEAPRSSADKAKAVVAALEAIEKQHGKGTILRLGDRVGEPVPCFPTGIYDVDRNVCGIGGFPKGRVVEIFGPESSGKTTLMLSAIAEAQKAGEQCAIVDAEHALDPTWASKNGVDVDKLLVSQPDNGEQALEVAEELVRCGGVGIIGIDSVAALVPRAELDGEMGDSHVGLQARLMSQALRKLTSIVNKSQCTIIFINQIREKIGVMFGSPETTTGGRALKFYASVRIDMRRVGQIKEGDVIIGAKTKIKAVKNKMSPPFRETEIDLFYSSGLDKIGNVLDAAVRFGVVEKSGSWLSYKSERLGQGKANAVASLREEPDLYSKIFEELLAKDVR